LSRTTSPLAVTSRAGRFEVANSPMLRSPRTSAVVGRVFASTQVGAATDAVRNTGAAGMPVTESTMWCKTRPSRTHLPGQRARGRERGARREHDGVGGLAGAVLDEDLPIAGVRGGAGGGDVPAEVELDAGGDPDGAS
jgi:hypothetical protein